MLWVSSICYGPKSLYGFPLSQLVFTVVVSLEYILRFSEYIYVPSAIAEGLDNCCEFLVYVMVLGLYMDFHYLIGSSFIIVVSLYYILKIFAVGLHFPCGSSVYFVFFSLFLCWSSITLWKFRFFVVCSISFIGERFCIGSLVTL